MTRSRQSPTGDTDGKRRNRASPPSRNGKRADGALPPSRTGRRRDGASLSRNGSIPTPLVRPHETLNTAVSEDARPSRKSPQPQRGAQAKREARPRPDHHRPRGRDPTASRGRARESYNTTTSQIRRGRLELGNPHLMSPKQLARAVLPYLVVMTARGAVILAGGAAAAVMFRQLVDVLAAHSKELRLLNFGELRTTIWGVWIITAIGLAGRALYRLPHRGQRSESDESSQDWSDLQELADRDRSLVRLRIDAGNPVSRRFSAAASAADWAAGASSRRQVRQVRPLRRAE